MYSLAISLTLTENKNLDGENLVPPVRDNTASEVSISPVIMVDGNDMPFVRATLHNLIDDFINDMIESGELSEFMEED